MFNSCFRFNVWFNGWWLKSLLIVIPILRVRSMDPRIVSRAPDVAPHVAPRCVRHFQLARLSSILKRALKVFSSRPQNVWDGSHFTMDDGMRDFVHRKGWFSNSLLNSWIIRSIIIYFSHLLISIPSWELCFPKWTNFLGGIEWGTSIWFKFGIWNKWWLLQIFVWILLISSDWGPLCPMIFPILLGSTSTPSFSKSSLATA